MQLDLIPQPQRLTRSPGTLRWDASVQLTPEVIPEVTSKAHALRAWVPPEVTPEAPEEDRFAAGGLAAALEQDFQIKAAVVADAPAGPTRVVLTRAADLPAQGYRLTIASDGVRIEGADAAGVYYAVQTLLQCLQHAEDGGAVLPCLYIEDWPALPIRAAHYDTKHHQDTFAYVEQFIRELAHYKINVLVWEWEDKFAYATHPEIGAPGAFTPDEMRRLTALARQHHVQLVPLVQGLGHVSYILKHPQYHHLREVADSNWQFNPLEEGTYDLLFDLFDEAIDATPGSAYIHIGSDETYELGQGRSRAKAQELGPNGLMQLFLRRCVEHCESRGRKVLSWGGAWKPDQTHQPPRSMIFVDSSDAAYLRQAKQAGYDCWVYASNPGIVPLIVPLFPWVQQSPWEGNSEGNGRARDGTFRQTSRSIAQAAIDGSVAGSITTIWDDSGLHNQCWMPRLICGAAFSWNPVPSDADWASTFFRRYFGPDSRDMPELFARLFDSAQFYYHTLQRAAWHWFHEGKMRLPDLPHNLDLEFHPFWRIQYKDLLVKAKEQCRSLERALTILDAPRTRHHYDLKIYRSCAQLMLHNVRLILMLAELEDALRLASLQYHFADNRKALEQLRHGAALVRASIDERERMFNELVAVWEQTRLPKGLSLPGQPFFYARDRARHFANRTPDMRYLIVDEDRLGLEAYLRDLTALADQYERECCDNDQRGPV